MTEKTTLSQPMTLSEIECAIDDFNVAAEDFKRRRDTLVGEIERAGLGKRFAQRSLASVSIKMPEGK